MPHDDVKEIVGAKPGTPGHVGVGGHGTGLLVMTEILPDRSKCTRTVAQTEKSRIGVNALWRTGRRAPLGQVRTRNLSGAAAS